MKDWISVSISAIVVCLLCLSPANADMAVQFIAADDPASGNDATNNNGGVADVWTFTQSGMSLFSGDTNNNSTSDIGDAWGISAGGTSGANVAEIETSFSQSLLAGSTLSIDFDNQFAASGQVGIEFLNSTGQVLTDFTLANFGFGGGVNYEVQGAATNVIGTQSGLNLTLTITDLVGGYQLDVDPFDTQLSDSIAGNFNFSGPVAGLRVFARSSGSNGFDDLFVNNLEIKAVPEPMTLLTFGLGIMLFPRRRR